MDLIRIKETPTPQTPIILENKRVLRLAEQLTRKLKIEENLMIYRKRKHEEEQHYVLKKNVRFDSELESIATGGESQDGLDLQEQVVMLEQKLNLKTQNVLKGSQIARNYIKKFNNL